MREKVGLMTKDGDVEPFYVCIFFTLTSSVPVSRSKGSTKFLYVKFTARLLDSGKRGDCVQRS
jgi:hypothetical protein